MPNYLDYQKSISKELIAIKDRVRNIILDHHWGEEGRYKEVILAEVIRNRLPNNVSVGTGFIINGEDISTQIDIIVFRNDIPLVFRQGDFVIVPAESVLGIIEVKTKHDQYQLRDAIVKSSMINHLMGDRMFFNGIFIYEIDFEWKRGKKSNRVPTVIENALKDCNGNVNYLCIGQDYFAKSWQRNQPEIGLENAHYSFYRIHNLSFGYFISNLIEDAYIMSKNEPLPYTLNKMFYPIEKTKEAHRFDDFNL